MTIVRPNLQLQNTQQVVTNAHLTHKYWNHTLDVDPRTCKALILFSTASLEITVWLLVGYLTWSVFHLEIVQFLLQLLSVMRPPPHQLTTFWAQHLVRSLMSLDVRSYTPHAGEVEGEMTEELYIKAGYHVEGGPWNLPPKN